MHWFNKGTVSCKQEAFPEDAVRSLLSKGSLLLSNISDAPSPALQAAAKFAIIGEKR